MPGFSDYLAARWKWAAEGVWSVYGKVAAGVTLVFAAIFYFWPEWFNLHMKDGVRLLLSALIPLSAIGLLFVIRWLSSPYFVWKEVKLQLKGKPRQQIVRKIVDEVGTSTGPFGDGLYRRPLICRLISASDDFGDESDVESVCRELADGGHEDPFADFETLYGTGSFEGKRLKFLKAASVTTFSIGDDRDAINYIESSWGEKNGLKQMTPSEILQSEKSVRTIMRHSIPRLKRRFLSGDQP